MSELKCCPFCGGEVVISDEKIDATREVYNFHCHNCDMVTFYDFPNDKEKAIETWNTRTPMANIVEKLEEREKYLEKAMKESHEKGYSSSEAKAMNERVAIRYAINIVKQEINNAENNT